MLGSRMLPVVLAIVVAAVLVGSAAYAADEPTASKPTASSVGVSLSQESFSVTWIDDGKNYGIGLGKTISRQDLLRLDAMLIFEPEDDRQLATGFALGYDLKVHEKVSVTPLVGILTDITSGYDGKSTRFFYGVCVKFEL